MPTGLHRCGDSDFRIRLKWIGAVVRLECPGASHYISRWPVGEGLGDFHWISQLTFNISGAEDVLRPTVIHQFIKTVAQQRREMFHIHYDEVQCRNCRTTDHWSYGLALVTYQICITFHRLSYREQL